MNINEDVILTETEKTWLQRVLNFLYEDCDYVITWHLRETFGIPTSLVNYNLSKLEKKGYLLKEAHKSHTKFHLTELSKKYKN